MKTVITTIVRTFLGLIMVVGFPVLWADAQQHPPIFGKDISPEFLTLAAAQQNPPTVGNPVAVEFEFLDWEQATGYEVDIVDQATKVVTNTLTYGPSKALPGTITLHLDVNVQPVKHGVYVFVARGRSAAGLTPNSLPSDPWERKPGPPGKPVAIGK